MPFFYSNLLSSSYSNSSQSSSTHTNLNFQRFVSRWFITIMTVNRSSANWCMLHFRNKFKKKRTMCKSLPLCPGSFCSEIQMLNSCIELKGPCAWSELIGDCCQVDWFPFGRSEWLHLPIVKANKWWDTPPVSSRSPACFPFYMPQRWLCLLLCGFANHALWQVFFFPPTPFPRIITRESRETASSECWRPMVAYLTVTKTAVVPIYAFNFKKS